MLPKSATIERLVITSLNCQYEVLAGTGGDLNPLTFNSKTSSREYYQQPVDVAQANLPLPTIMDRLRLRFTRDAMPAKPEPLFEIEMYGKTGKIPPQ